MEIQLKRDDKAGFRKHQQIKLGESDSEQPLHFCKPIVVATGEFSREEMLRPIVTSPLSNILEEQLKHVQKAITIEVRPKKRSLLQ